MSYPLTDEQELMRQAAREFAVNEIRPRMPEIEKTREVPLDLLRKCADAGLLGIALPTDLGGHGLGIFEEAIVTEELGKESVGFAFLYSGHNGAIPMLFAYPELAKHAPDALAGTFHAQVGVSDPAGATNIDDWSVLATRDGDDWVLSGTKLFVSGASYSDLGMVCAKCDDGNFRLFYAYEDEPGFDNKHPEVTLGMAGHTIGSQNWSNVRVPDSRALPWDPNFASFGSAILLATVTGFGGAVGAFERTVEFLKARKRAGRPLIEHQVVSHQLASMYMRLEVGRHILYNSLKAFDAGQPDENIAHVVKAWVPEMTVDIARECLQLHGGLGYCEETGIARYLRDVIGPTIADFPTNLQLQTIAHNMGWSPERGL